MAINLSIYSNAYNTTKTVAVDFIAEIVAIEEDVTVDDTNRYFFKFTTAARDTNNTTYPARIVQNLSDLALNKTKQSATDTANAYSSIKTMIIDYVYDYIHGHVADQFSSGCKLKAPMKFSS
jgi:hypothetical protein